MIIVAFLGWLSTIAVSAVVIVYSVKNSDNDIEFKKYEDGEEF